MFDVDTGHLAFFLMLSSEEGLDWDVHLRDTMLWKILSTCMIRVLFFVYCKMSVAGAGDSVGIYQLTLMRVWIQAGYNHEIPSARTQYT
jgi:hypothetical protein